MRISHLIFASAFASVLLLDETSAFQSVIGRPVVSLIHLRLSSSDSVQADVETDEMSRLRSAEAAKFKILTCTSTACAKKRSALTMDEYATYGAFFGRIQENSSEVSVEESPCLGSCKMAPCVAIEHEDYEGTVALEGMTANEFSSSCFHNIVTEEDADRVWSSVKDAVELMMAEEDEEDSEEE